jgi:hypothetical protein
VRLEKQDMADVAFNLFSQGKDVWTLADEDRARPFRFEADRLHLLEACKMAGLADPTGLLP